MQQKKILITRGNEKGVVDCKYLPCGVTHYRLRPSRGRYLLIEWWKHQNDNLFRWEYPEATEPEKGEWFPVTSTVTTVEDLITSLKPIEVIE